jgi:hypothetical protein
MALVVRLTVRIGQTILDGQCWLPDCDDGCDCLELVHNGHRLHVEWFLCCCLLFAAACYCCCFVAAAASVVATCVTNLVDMPATYVVPTITMVYTHHHLKHNASFNPTLSYSPSTNFLKQPAPFLKLVPSARECLYINITTFGNYVMKIGFPNC